MNFPIDCEYAGDDFREWDIKEGARTDSVLGVLGHEGEASALSVTEIIS